MVSKTVEVCFLGHFMILWNCLLRLGRLVSFATHFILPQMLSGFALRISRGGKKSKTLTDLKHNFNNSVFCKGGVEISCCLSSWPQLSMQYKRQPWSHAVSYPLPFVQLLLFNAIPLFHLFSPSDTNSNIFICLMESQFNVAIKPCWMLQEAIVSVLKRDLMPFITWMFWVLFSRCIVLKSNHVFLLCVLFISVSTMKEDWSRLVSHFSQTRIPAKSSISITTNNHRRKINTHAHTLSKQSRYPVNIVCLLVCILGMFVLADRTPC